MNKLMRKLSISILAVVFAVVAMGATTFAWFTLTNTAKVEQFEVQVTTAAGIELSMDGTSWSSVLTPSQFAAGLTSQSATEPALTAVTTIDGVDFMKLTNLSKAGEGSFAAADAGVDFFEFDIYIRTTQASQKIYLSNANTTVDSTVIPWLVDNDFTPSTGSAVPAGSSLNVYPEDAVRIAFDEASVHVFQVPTAGTNTAGQAFDWDLGALNYYGVDKGYFESAPAPTDPAGDGDDYAFIGTVNPLGTAYTTEVATTSGTATDGYYETTVTVRIWLDGWDQECYNAIFGGLIQINIGFTTDPSAA